MTRRQTALIILLLVILALGLRLLDLGSSLTPDERLWSQRTTQFIQALDDHNWGGTLTSGHPGVMVMWAGTTGVALKALVDPPADASDLPQLVAALAQEPSRIDLIAWLRLPIALVTLAGLLLIVLLARRLLGRPAALLGAALLCLDPFLLAHSRVLQMDALLATAVSVAWLALLVAMRTGRSRYLVVCGIAAALGFLTKASALALGPAVVGWVLWQHWRNQPAAVFARRLAATLVASFTDLLWIGIPALLTAWLLWPALWTAPLATLIHVWRFATAIGGADHELGNFWLGQPVASPGALFYPVVLLLRTTAISLIGLALAGLALVWPAWRKARDRSGPAIRARAPAAATQGTLDAERQAAWALLGFALWFALVMSLGDKAFDRYLLPVFPIVDLLAAWGWIRTVRWLTQRKTGPDANRSPSARPAVVLAGLLVLLQAASAVANRPTYLTAYNPLLGGIRTARQVMLVGWGEGLEEAAHFLNEQSTTAIPRVASWYGHNVFGPFYKGESFDLYYDLSTASDLYAQDIDYVVTYVNQMQRKLLDVSIQSRLGLPLMASTHADVPLAQVYPWPKPFQHTADLTLADGLHLLGWNLGPLSPLATELPVTLFWDAAAVQSMSDTLVPVLAWLKDDTGEVWAQVEGPVVAGALRAIPAWESREAVSQTLTLRLPSGLFPGKYRVEMAPEAASSIILGSVSISPSVAGEAPPSDVVPVPERVVFGDAVTLVGYQLDTQNRTWRLDLLWAAIAAPPADAKFFVHVVDPAGHIVAQADGTLAAPASGDSAGWQQGHQVRQRVVLHMPEGTNTASYRIYMGLYQPESGTRLPANAGGETLLDNRYLLPE